MKITERHILTVSTPRVLAYNRELNDMLQEAREKTKDSEFLERVEVAIRCEEITCLDECSYMSEEMWDEAIDSLARTKGLG